jgi:hypothetical protein
MGQFANAVAKFANTTEQRMDATVRGAALMTLESVVQGTPVDKGRAKGNWQLSVDTPAEGDVTVPESESKETASNTAEQIALATRNNLVPGGALGHTIYITNNVPYIIRLEQGHSGQGEHFIQGAVDQFQEFVRVSEANAKAVYPD